MIHRLLLSTLLILFPGLAASFGRYGVVIDAGSSGSRVRIYGWERASDAVPDFREIHSVKVKPGIASFASNLVGLRVYIQPLIEEAKKVVPQHQYDETPIYVLATAGMRLLLEDQANDVIDHLDHILEQQSFNPFSYTPGHTRILSGEEEGVFAWIAANYLNGYFDNGERDGSVGILELGGASTQIAFVPEGSILADKFPVSIGGRTYSVYVHSYLYYGQNYVVRRIKERLIEADTTLDPCMLQGDSVKYTIDGVQHIFNGTGQPDKCLSMMERFIYKPHEDFCYPKPCAIGTVYQPTIEQNQLFFALSAFVFPPQRFGALEDDGMFTPLQLRKKSMELCKMNLTALMEKTQQGPDFLSTECTMALYMTELFTTGYGFQNFTTQIMAVQKVNKRKIEWPLGAIIYETERTRCRPGPIHMAVRGSASSHKATLSIILIALEIICGSFIALS